jgi:hypothetical protein
VPADDGRCKDCLYAAGDEKSFLTGRMECHRYPPALKGVDAFPEVGPDSWCGEFAARDGELSE